MTRLILFLVASFALLASCLAEDFGAKTSSVTDAVARTLSGYGAAGVAVDSVDEGGLAAFFDLRAHDVILELNGVRTTRPEDLARSARSRAEQNTVTYARNGRKWTLTVAAAAIIRIAFVLQPETVADPENPWAKVGTATGLVSDYTTTIPQNLSKYAAVVLASDRAAKPETIAVLKAYLAKGGGIVLLGTTPVNLCGGHDKTWDPWYGGSLTNDIAEWFGCAHLYERDTAGADLLIHLNKPFSSDFSPGDKLFQFIGRQPGLFAMGDKLADTAVPVATWASVPSGLPAVPLMEGAEKPTGAFYNRYGDGRVYWQFEALTPNYPRLQELLIAAIRWAANASATRRGGS